MGEIEMIITTTQVEVFLGNGKTKVLPIPIRDPNIQLFELTISMRSMDNKTGIASYSPTTVRVIHVPRELLEKANILPETGVLPQKKITVEDLLTQVLEHLGVKFEE